MNVMNSAGSINITLSTGEPLANPTPPITLEAHELVHGARRATYGHPIFDATRTADMVTAQLRGKLRPGVRLEAEDITKIMISVKLSRETFVPKRDNRVDMAGYAEVLDVIAKWREEHPGEDPRNHY